MHDIALQFLAGNYEHTCNKDLLVSYLIENKILIPSLRQNSGEVYKDTLLKHQSLSLLLSQETKKIIRHFNEQDVTCIPLKGCFFAKKYYGSEENRDFSDIDLLVHSTDYQRAEAVLENLGYGKDQQLSSVENYVEKSIVHSSEFIKKNLEINVDLHWSLAERFYVNRKFTEIFWDYSSKEEYDGIYYYYPKPELNLLFMCLHAYKQRWNVIGTLLDIYNIQQKEDVNKKELTILAESFDLTLILNKGLEITKELFDDNKYKLHEDGEIFHLVNYKKKISSKIKSIILRYFIPFGDDWKNLPVIFSPIYFLLKPLRTLLKAVFLLGTYLRKYFAEPRISLALFYL